MTTSAVNLGFYVVDPLLHVHLLEVFLQPADPADLRLREVVGGVTETPPATFKRPILMPRG